MASGGHYKHWLDFHTVEPWQRGQNTWRFRRKYKLADLSEMLILIFLNSFTPF